MGQGDQVKVNWGTGVQDDNDTMGQRGKWTSGQEGTREQGIMGAMGQDKVTRE